MQTVRAALWTLKQSDGKNEDLEFRIFHVYYKKGSNTYAAVDAPLTTEVSTDSEKDRAPPRVLSFPSGYMRSGGTTTIVKTTYNQGCIRSMTRQPTLLSTTVYQGADDILHEGQRLSDFLKNNIKTSKKKKRETILSARGLGCSDLGKRCQKTLFHLSAKSSASANDNVELAHPRASKRGSTFTSFKAQAVRNDVQAVFESLLESKSLPANLQIQIIPVGPTGFKLSPPPYEFEGKRLICIL
jgi:hypothetical protein